METSVRPTHVCLAVRVMMEQTDTRACAWPDIPAPDVKQISVSQHRIIEKKHLINNQVHHSPRC